MYRMTALDREILKFARKTSPLGMFAAGLKQYAGKVWLPTKENERKAREQIDKLLKKAKKDPVARKFLRAERRGLSFEEPLHYPGAAMNYLYLHFLLEGFKRAHITKLAEGGLKILELKRYLLKKKWPAEIKIHTVLACDGCLGVIAHAKKNVKGKRVHARLDALAAEVRAWRKHFIIGKIKKGDYSEIFPLLKKHGQGFGRQKIYPKLLRDFYDYPETHGEIEKKATGWLEEELPKFRAITAKLASKLGRKPDPGVIEKELKNKCSVSRNKLIKTILDMRKILQVVADKHWVRITPKYDVKVIETPKYLVPFLPTGAMNSFNTLKGKPHCVFYATTDPRGSPSLCIPDLAQLIIHEEYGHCVNFMNSYTGFQGKLRLVEIFGGSLDTPLTEGLSFHREIESLDFFRHLEHEYQLSKNDKKLVAFITKYADLETFNDMYEFVLRKWRVIRILRAITDTRVNSGKQRFDKMIEWASKKTGLPKKIIYDQTFNFMENPGYAPGYSVFGQRLRELQNKAMSKGISRVAFNTFVASRGFPARTIFEKELKQKFRL